MKKLFSLFTALACAGMMMATETELFSHEQTEVSSSGGAGDPIVTPVPATESYTVELVGTPGWQWGNQAKIKLNNVSATGLDVNKEYKLSFHAEASTTDCGGVTLKFFDDNELFYTGANYLNFGTPVDFESEWIKPTKTETNATIVFDFGWDPVQTITLSNFSFKVRDIETAIDEVESQKVESKKIIEDGKLIIIKNGVRYDATGQVIR